MILGVVASSGVLPATTLSATVSSYVYTGDDEWNNAYPVVSLTWTAVVGATDGYVIYKDGTQVATAAAGATSANYQTVVGDVNTARAYTVRAKAGSTLGIVSNTKTVNIGQPRTRYDATDTYTGEAQEDYTGTTNGRWTISFTGSLFGVWIKSVSWTLTVPFGSAGNFVTASSVNRNCVLIQPGTDFDVPDDQREPYTRTVTYTGRQDGTWGVNPNGTGWSSHSSGTIGTYHIDATIVIASRKIQQNETAPTVA